MSKLTELPEKCIDPMLQILGCDMPKGTCKQCTPVDEAVQEPGFNGVVNADELMPIEVKGGEMSELEYWKQRCLLAEKCLEESPCDPDITSGQIEAHNNYKTFLSSHHQ